MKKLGLVIVLIMLVALAGCDISEPDDTKNKIIIKGPTIKEIISAENDGSEPPDSLIQRYKVRYLTKDNQEEVFLLQIETNKAGELVSASTVSTSKEGGSLPVVVLRCPADCDIECQVIWYPWPLDSYMICWCLC